MNSSLSDRRFSDDLKRNIVNRISVPLTFEVTESVLQAAVVACNFTDRHYLVIKRLDTVLEKLCELISTCDNVERVAKLLYVLLILFQSRTSHNSEIPMNFDTLVKLILKYVDSSNYLCSLRMLDSLSALQPENIENWNSIRTVFENLNVPNEPTKLINNLCSPFHKVRYALSEQCEL